MSAETLEHAVGTETFDTEVLKASVPVVVDFWAEWCGPCKMIAPVLSQLADQYKGKIKIAKVDVDTQGDLASRFDIISIPTLLVFKGGELVKKHVGAAPRSVLEQLVQSVL